MERQELQDAYLKDFRYSFRSQVEMLQVYDKEGVKEVTWKVKDINVKRVYVTINLGIPLSF